MKNPPFESPESASPSITRAVSAALAGKPFQRYEFPLWQKIALALLRYLPSSIVSSLAQWDISRAALPPSVAETLAIDKLVAERLADYDSLPGAFDCIVAGAALGGAAAHLAVALRAPFLPQPFVLNFRGGSAEDVLAVHLDNSTRLARGVLERNEGVLVIGHFDPVHDGWLTRKVNHLRLKLQHLPPGYREFVQKRLRKGGAILYLECTAQWMQYELSSDYVYQIGGWGGLSPREYLEGSARIDAYLGARGSAHRGGWRIPGLMPVARPESEWGSEPGLAEALECFALEEGYRFYRIQLPHPHDFSRLAYRSYAWLCRKGGFEPRGVLIETFGQYNPTAILQAGLLPLWLVFNTYDSLDFLQSMLPEFPAHKPLLFDGLVTLTRTPDMVPWEMWAHALSGFEWVNIGARPRYYPEDLAALWQGPRRLQRWVRKHPFPIETSLEVGELLEIAGRL